MKLSYKNELDPLKNVQLNEFVCNQLNRRLLIECKTDMIRAMRHAKSSCSKVCISVKQGTLSIRTILMYLSKT